MAIGIHTGHGRPLMVNNALTLRGTNVIAQPSITPPAVRSQAFPGGQLAHLEGQNEEENEKSLRKVRKIDPNLKTK